MRCAIWYHLYSIKNLKNTHGGVLVLVKLQASACNFTKINTPTSVFFTFFKLHRWYQIAQSITLILIIQSLTIYFVISKNSYMSLFGCFPFWAPIRFPEAIWPRYSPGFNLSFSRYVFHYSHDLGLYPRELDRYLLFCQTHRSYKLMFR